MSRREAVSASQEEGMYDGYDLVITAEGVADWTVTGDGYPRETYKKERG